MITAGVARASATCLVAAELAASIHVVPHRIVPCSHLTDAEQQEAGACQQDPERRDAARGGERSNQLRLG